MEPTIITNAGGTETLTVRKVEKAEDFSHYLRDLILEKQYETVAQLFTSEGCEKYFEFMKDIGSDVYREICLPQLNKSCYEMSFPLYSCVEELLKVIAQHGAREEILLELLELVEESDSEYVFTSALRAMQIVLLRLVDSKPLVLQWALNSVQTRLKKLTLPQQLTENYDEEKMALLEQDETIQTLLTHYITVGLFYTPLLQHSLNSTTSPTTVFRDNSSTQRNILCAFFLQLLDRPIALLQLKTYSNRPGSNAYTRQVTRQLVLSAVDCLKADPLYLLQFVEERLRYKRRLDSSRGVYELSSLNIFTVEEHVPILGVAVFYYLLFLEFKDTEQIKLPCIYAPLFTYERVLYLVNVFLKCEETKLHMLGLLLAQCLEKMLNCRLLQIPAKNLEIPLHREFCHLLTTVITYAEAVEVRRLGVQILDSYIHSFDDEGKYIVIKSLMSSVTNSSLLGHLGTLYKNLVSESLRANGFPNSFHLDDFRQVMLKNICYLPERVETDLALHASRIIATLNTLIYFGKADKMNLTGFWSFVDEIENKYLEPLRTALDFSISHYKEEIKQLEQGAWKMPKELREKMNTIEITKANGLPFSSQEEDLFNSEQRSTLLKQHLTTFDLIAYLRGYVTTILSANPLKEKNI